MNPCDPELGNGPSDLTPKLKQQKKKIDWTSPKLKHFCALKDTIKRVKKQSTEEKIFANKN